MPDQRDTGGALDVEDRFAIVPEWLLDAEVSDAAVRLYAVLLRYGQSSGARMPVALDVGGAGCARSRPTPSTGRCANSSSWARSSCRTGSTAVSG